MTYLLDTSSGVWLLSKTKTEDIWYEKLRKTSRSDDTVFNINVPKSECIKGQCLSLSQLHEFPQKFTINGLSCKEKRAAICRINPGVVNIPVKPPKFPCMTKNHDKRLKRSNDGLETGS